MTYYEAITAAMTMLADDPRTMFIGQSVRYKSNAIFGTLEGVPMERRIELPVIEDFQMGYCTGRALAGEIPVCIFPRMDFLLLAANQLVNHLDKIPLSTKFRPKVIIRTAVGAKYPLNSGQQHTQDHTAAFRLMLKTVDVIELNSRFDVAAGYKRALDSERSALVIERHDLFNE